MTVLTIFFCGTGSSKFDTSNPAYWDGELISTLASHCMGKEFAEWLLIDGPGSGNLQNDELWVQSGNYPDYIGTAFGHGWNENVNHALHLIKGNFNWQREKLTKEQYVQLKNAGVPIHDIEVTGSYFWRKYNYGDRFITQQQLQQQIIKMNRKDGIIPTRVNLVGWSRGAVSCHMLANAMYEDTVLRDIPVNIYAVDPVPGPLNFQAERVTLRRNVAEYVGFYARDERSKGFSCVVPIVENTTSLHIYPMAGRHATLVGNASANGDFGPKTLPESGRIVRHFAEVCLHRWGCYLNKKLNISDADLYEFHHKMEHDKKAYDVMSNTSYTMLTESINGERLVSHGINGVNFSSLHGDEFTPKSGLHSNYLNDKSIYDFIK